MACTSTLAQYRRWSPREQVPEHVPSIADLPCGALELSQRFAIPVKRGAGPNLCVGNSVKVADITDYRGRADTVRDAGREAPKAMRRRFRQSALAVHQVRAHWRWGGLVGEDVFAEGASRALVARSTVGVQLPGHRSRSYALSADAPGASSSTRPGRSMVARTR